MYCGPCALSALIGVPTSTWPDRGMSALEFERIASEAGAVRLSDADFAIGRKLGAFGNRVLYECSGGEYDGTWLILLGPSGCTVDDYDHAVAVSCSPRSRMLVDNRERVPVSFSRLRSRADSGWSGVVCAAWRWH